MRLKNDYGREFIFLDEESLIYRRKFRKIIIKRNINYILWGILN